MPDFPDFAKNAVNRVASSSQYTENVEGYVFDGADGSQVTLWTAHADRISEEHVHDFDEYVLIIEGRAVLFLGERRIELRAGQEFVIPRGTRQRMEVSSRTRTMHVFGGRRARRACIPPWVPPEMLAQLDLSELSAEQPGLREECARLGILLGANVAAYGRAATGRPRGLCSYYRTMDLEPARLAELTRAEARFSNVVFVAYRNPLERYAERPGT